MAGACPVELRVRQGMERLIDQGRKVKRSSAVRIGGCSAPATAVSALTFESSLVMDWATRVPRDAAQLHAKLKVAEDRARRRCASASLACLARVWRTRVWRVSGVLYENFLYCFQGGPPGRSAADYGRRSRTPASLPHGWPPGRSAGAKGVAQHLGPRSPGSHEGPRRKLMGLGSLLCFRLLHFGLQ